ncbi:hypothetical protein VNI00_014533 [Paramarasmius palmivorus]|uniref:Uncharacterized protein n=1 Tax=Paramarasmius palmivorus TaxID=297713 RepID=A0AAW0BRS2_9AGAR
MAELQFLRDEYPRMAQLVRGEMRLAQWTPPEGCPHSEHILSLGVPEHRLYEGPGGSFPNLLLHELGSLSQTSGTVNTILKALFENGDDRLLLNCSGSGKTRLLLEGLCLHWGLYFSCASDTSVGSMDLFDTMTHGLPQEGLTPRPDLADSTSIRKNHDIAARKLSEVLLARLLLLQYFLSLIDQVGEEHKQRWLYLQLQPTLLGHDETRPIDIFHACTRRLSSKKMSSAQLTAAIHHVLKDISRKIGRRITVVIDEAQSAVDLHSFAFTSQRQTYRPALRELLEVWGKLMPDTTNTSSLRAIATNYIISGTGFDQRLIMEALSSTGYKSKNVSSWYFTGSFDSQKAQSDYVYKFLPPALRQSDEGRALMRKMFFWLRGRHRFTAQFMALLLYNGFARPHDLLDEYIEALGEFRPTDARTSTYNGRLQHNPGDSSPVEIPLIQFQPLDFEKVQNHGFILANLKNLCHAYVLHGVYPDVLRDGQLDYVQSGIGRIQTHRDANVITVIEPLVLFACFRWLDRLEPHTEPKSHEKLEQLAKKTPVQLEECLRTSVDSSDIYERLSLYDVAELKDQLEHFRALPGAMDVIPNSAGRSSREDLYDQLLGACKAFHRHVLDSRSDSMSSDEAMEVDGTP